MLEPEVCLPDRPGRVPEANGFSFARLQDSVGYEGMMFTYGANHHRWLTESTRTAGRAFRVHAPVGAELAELGVVHS